jgi:hypothetical protein
MDGIESVKNRQKLQTIKAVRPKFQWWGTSDGSAPAGFWSKLPATVSWTDTEWELEHREALGPTSKNCKAKW